MQTEALSGVVKGGGKDEEEKLKEFMKRVSGMMLSQLNNNANSKAFRGFFYFKKISVIRIIVRDQYNIGILSTFDNKK